LEGLISPHSGQRHGRTASTVGMSLGSNTNFTMTSISPLSESQMRENKTLNPISPYASCPCESGKKYKWCCLPIHKAAIDALNHPMPMEVDDLDELSNSVLDLIQEGRLEEAEKACEDLLSRYPDQLDGIDRMARVEKARGHHAVAAALWRRAAAWALAMPDFETETVDDYREQARAMDDAAREVTA
jgi:hypothetical protein